MGKHLSALAALLMSGCAATHGEFETMCDGPLRATVTIEETGEVLAVADVHPRGSITREGDSLSIRLAHGESIDVLFGRPAALGRELHFADLPTDRVPEVRASLGRRLVGLCWSSATTEGELILDYVRIGPDDFVDCAIGSLRVRFADCEAEVFGRSASETTFLIEIGR